MSLSSLPFSDVDITAFVAHLAPAVAPIVSQMTFVGAISWHDELSSAAACVFYPFSFVEFAICIEVATLALFQVSLEVANIDCAIRVDFDSFAILLVVDEAAVIARLACFFLLA